MKAKAIQFFLVLFFAFPFISLFFYFRPDFNFNIDEITWALKNSLIQSSLTAVISVFLGFLGALGILTVEEKYRRPLKFLAVIPVFLPTLFSVMIGLALVNPFPMGSLAVVFILSLMYIGYASSLLSEQIEMHLGNLGVVASIYKISKLNFWSRILIPLIWRPALYIFAVIFVNAFTAFTVPLLVGGGRGTNFEVLIYEKIFVEQNWSLAVGLSILQMGFVALFAATLQRKTGQQQSIFGSSAMTMSKAGLWGIILYILLYFSGYIKLALSTIHIYYMREIFNESFFVALAQSLIFFVICYMLFFVLFAVISYAKYYFVSIRFLNFFLNPSSVLTGFAFYLLFSHNNITTDFLKLALVFTVVGFVSFFKSTLESQMHLFEKSIQVSRSFGISFFTFFFKIFLPQIKQRLYYATSLMFIFCISEFGLVKVSGANIKTMGTEMASYLTSYRIEGAFVISLVMLAIWFGAIFSLGAVFGNNQKS